MGGCRTAEGSDAARTRVRVAGESIGVLRWSRSRQEVVLPRHLLWITPDGLHLSLLKGRYRFVGWTDDGEIWQWMGAPNFVREDGGSWVHADGFLRLKDASQPFSVWRFPSRGAAPSPSRSIQYLAETPDEVTAQLHELEFEE